MTNEMKDYLNNMSTITLTGVEDTVTITDSMGTDYTLSDDTTLNINLDTVDSYFDTDLTTVTVDSFNNNASLTLGGTTLDEDTVKKLKALLEVVEDLEDDNALKELYNAQVMLNKIKGK